MPLRHTRGFRSALHRSDHFQVHGVGLGLIGEDDYEAFADWFLRQPRPAGVEEFIRQRNGDLVRYDEAGNVFAILARDRFIKTCYRPDPSVHGERTNLDYYLKEKAKR